MKGTGTTLSFTAGYLQGAPLPVINGVISYNPYKWPYKLVTAFGPQNH